MIAHALIVVFGWILSAAMLVAALAFPGALIALAYWPDDAQRWGSMMLIGCATISIFFWMGVRSTRIGKEITERSMMFAGDLITNGWPRYRG